MTGWRPLELIHKESLALFNLYFRSPLTASGTPVEANLPFNDLSFVNGMVTLHPARRMRSTVQLRNTRVCHLVSSITREPVPSRCYYFSLVALITAAIVSRCTVFLIKFLVIDTSVDFFGEKNPVALSRKMKKTKNYGMLGILAPLPIPSFKNKMCIFLPPVSFTLFISY